MTTHETEVLSEDEHSDVDVDVDNEDLTFLIELGIDADRARQALIAVKEGGRTAALDWLTENATAEEAREAEAGRPKLTPEEAARKAAELQVRLREARMRRDQEEERTREKNRIASQKALLEAQRQFAEAEKKRAAEWVVREKEEKRQAEEKQRQLLALDYKERFGKEMSLEEAEEAQLSKKSARERCLHYLGILRSEMGEVEDKTAIITCLKTLRLYCNNAKTNPLDQKYRAIRKSNKAFTERIIPFPAALKLLEAAGFQESSDGEWMRIETAVPDGFTLGECIKFLDFLISR